MRLELNFVRTSAPNDIAVIAIKVIAKILFAQKYVKLDVFAQLDLHVIQSLITVSQKKTVIPDHLFQLAMWMKNGTHVVVNVKKDIAVTLKKATVQMKFVQLFVSHVVNAFKVMRGHIKVIASQKQNAFQRMEFYGIQQQQLPRKQLLPVHVPQEP